MSGQRASGIGSPLPEGVRTEMETAFGADFSDVRVSEGPSAPDIGARAYTQGNAIQFAPGEYRPSSRGGRELLGHELAHVVQQREGRAQKMARAAGVNVDDRESLEREADVMGARAARGEVMGRGGGRERARAFGPAQLRPGAPVQRKELPEGDEAFDEMWEEHPHSNSDRDDENTSSDDVIEEQGLPSWLGDTCAIRISTMLNEIGEEVTPKKASDAGLPRRPMRSSEGSYYILAASEMWLYLSRHFRGPDAVFPDSGEYDDEAAFQADFNQTIRPLVASRKGIVAFDTIFGYSGTGHVDIFDGEKLSASNEWYACKRLLLWYVVVP